MKKGSRRSGPILVIEAPGKVRAVARALAELGIPGVQIIATGGRMYDLPSDRLGIDWKGTGLSPEWVPTGAERLARLEQVLALNPESPVWLLTDDDQEGELIAWHVEQLAGASRCVRFRARAMSPEGLKEAFARPDHVHKPRAHAAIARRLVDRFVGFGLSAPYKPEIPARPRVIGRIRTPVIASLIKQPGVAGIFTIDTPNGWRIKLTAQAGRRAEAEQWLRYASTLPDPVVREAGDPEPLPWSPFRYGDLLREVVDTLEVSVKEAAERIQASYEEGRISYPRTDADWVRLETAGHLQKLASRFGVQVSDRRPLQEKASPKDAHEAIHPLRIDSSLLELDYISPGDEIAAILLRHWLEGLSGAARMRQLGQLDSGAYSSRDWADCIRQAPGSVLIHRSLHMTAAGALRLIDPLYEPYGRRVSPDLRFGIYARARFISPARQALERMLELGLTRPSTLSRHASSIASLLDDEGAPRGIALQAYQLARELCPPLTGAKMARRLDALLYREEVVSIDDRVQKALELLGVRLDDKQETPRHAPRDAPAQNLNNQTEPSVEKPDYDPS